MNTTAPNPIPPRDPRHQRFADEHVNGKSLTEAYIAAGYKCSRPTATVNAKKLRRRPQVAAYITALQERAALAAFLSIDEILRFCARVVRTGIGDLDPAAGSPTADLIKSYNSTEGELGNTARIEKHCPFKAIDVHLKLSGEDPHTNALRDLAAALGALGGEVLPSDKM